MSLQFVIIISFFFFQPSTVTFREKFYTHPPLLPGEQIVLQQDHVMCVDTFSDIAQGILHITTYRIIFAGTHAQVHNIYIKAFTPYQILTNSNYLNLQRAINRPIILICKNLQLKLPTYRR